MKLRCSSILKAALALVLAFLLLFGTVATGTAALVKDITTSGAKADLTAVGDVATYNFGGKTVYLKINDSYPNGDTAGYIVCAWNSNNSSSWSSSIISDTITAYRSDSGTDTFYYCTIQAGTYTGYQWRRVNPNNSSEVWGYGPSIADNRNATYIGGYEQYSDTMWGSTYNLTISGNTYYCDATGNSSWSASPMGFSNNSSSWGGAAATEIATGLFKYTTTQNWSGDIYWVRAANTDNAKIGINIGDAHFDGKNATYINSATNNTDSAVQTTIVVSGVSTPTVTASDPDPVSGDSVTFTSSAGTLAYTRGGTACTAALLSGDVTYTFKEGGTTLQSGSSNTFTTSTLSVGSHTITCEVSSTVNSATSTAGSASVTVSAATTPTLTLTADKNNYDNKANIGETVSITTLRSNATGSNGIQITSVTVDGDPATEGTHYEKTIYGTIPENISIVPLVDGVFTVTASYVDGTSAEPSDSVTFGVNTPTITVGNNTTLLVGESYTPSPTLTNPSSTSAGWTVSYAVKTGTTATTDGSTITAVGCGSATTFYAYFKYNNTIKAQCEFDVTPVTPTITVSDNTTLKIGESYTPTPTLADPSSATGLWTVVYSVKTGTTATTDGSAITAVNCGSATTFNADFKYDGTTMATTTFTVTPVTPVLSMSDLTVTKGCSGTFTTSDTGGNTNLSYSYAVSPAVSGVSIDPASGVVTVGSACEATTATIVATATYGATYSDTVSATLTITNTVFAVGEVTNGGTEYLTIGTPVDYALSNNFGATDVDVSVSPAGVVSASKDLAGDTLTLTPSAKGVATVTVTFTNPSAPGVAAGGMNMTSYKMKKIELAPTGAGAIVRSFTFTVKVADAEGYTYVYLNDFWYNTDQGWGHAYIHAWKNTGGDVTYADRAQDSGAMTCIGKNENGNNVYAYRFTNADYANIEHITFCIGKDSQWDAGGNWNRTITFDAPFATNGYYLKTDLKDGQLRDCGTYNCLITRPQITLDGIASLPVTTSATMTANVVTSGTPEYYYWDSDNSLVYFTTDSTDTASNTVTAGSMPGSSTITVHAFGPEPTGWDLDYNPITEPFLATTATATVTVTAENKSLDYTSSGCGAHYSDDGSAYTSGATGGTLTITQGGSLYTSGTTVPYGTNLQIDADAESGYTVKGIYWSTNGVDWVDAGGAVTYSANGMVDTLTIDAFSLTDNFKLKAEFVKTFEFNFFQSYVHNDSTGAEDAEYAIPGSVRVSDGVDDTVTYFHSTTGISSGASNYAQAYDTTSAYYHKFDEGNIITVPAGYTVSATYSALASSDKIATVSHNATNNYIVGSENRTTEGRVNDAVTIDQVSHTVVYSSVASDFRNITIETEPKKRIYINYKDGKSDFTGLAISGMNSGGYYYAGERVGEVSSVGDVFKISLPTSSDYTYFFESLASAVTVKDGPESTDNDIKTSGGWTITAYDSSDNEETTTVHDIVYYTVSCAAMPDSDVYITIDVEKYFTISLDSKIIWDNFEKIYRTATIADIRAVDADHPENVFVSSLSEASTSFTVSEDTSIKFTMSFKSSASLTSENTGESSTRTLESPSSYYSLSGWYSGTYAGIGSELSTGATYVLKPKANTSLVATAVRDLYINGNAEFMGSEHGGWYVNSTNRKMSYDPVANAFYYQSALDDSNYGSGQFKVFNGKTVLSDYDVWTGSYLWCDDENSSYYYGVKYGKNEDYTNNGWIVSDSLKAGYGTPIYVWYYPSESRMYVKATYLYTNLYVSSGYSGIDSASNTSTSEVTQIFHVVDDEVINDDEYTGVAGDGWDAAYETTGDPDPVTTYFEGKVSHRLVPDKDAIVRVYKTVNTGYKVASFVCYVVSTHKVIPLDAVLDTDTTTSYYAANTYYADVDTSYGDMYVCPIIEDKNADLTINFDATDLDEHQWGSLVSCYAWYSGTGGNANGAYPGQLMIPSADGSTWTAHINSKNANNNDITGITFANYYEVGRTWLTRSTVTNPGSATTNTIVGRYNTPGDSSGASSEYIRYNLKVQTYDYREPIAMFENIDDGSTANLSFSIKSGNSDAKIILSTHQELINANIFTGYTHGGDTFTFTSSSFETLTDKFGSTYSDLRGEAIDGEPEPAFYIIAKGMVSYESSSMKKVYSTGDSYDSSDTTDESASGYYDPVTYGVGSVNMDNAVQWYVYDASGNYLTNMLSSGYADRVDNTTLIAKKLTEMGYQPDGKAVAIAYDNPRLCFNSAYRFTGQWYQTIDTTPVTAKVKVGFFVDGAEYVSDSNTASYGTAVTKYDATRGDTSNASFAATLDPALSGGVGVEAQSTTTALGDSMNRPVEFKVTENISKFVGWYYYDANNTFTKVTSHSSPTGFYPEYGNTEETVFYAMFRMTATYNFVYKDRNNEDVTITVDHDLRQDEIDGYSGNNYQTNVPTFIWTSDADKNYEFSPLLKAYNLYVRNKVSTYRKDIAWPEMAPTSYESANSSGITYNREQMKVTIEANCTTSKFIFKHTITGVTQQVENVDYGKIITFNSAYSSDTTGQFQYINATVPAKNGSGEDFSYWSSDSDGNKILTTNRYFNMILTEGNTTTTDEKDTMAIYAQYGKSLDGFKKWTPMFEDVTLNRKVTTDTDTYEASYLTNYFSKEDLVIRDLINAGGQTIEYGIIVVKTDSANASNFTADSAESAYNMKTIVKKMVANNHTAAYTDAEQHGIAYRFAYNDTAHISSFNRCLYNITSNVESSSGMQLVSMAYFRIGNSLYYTDVDSSISYRK